MSPSLKVGPSCLFVSGEVEQRAIVLVGNIFQQTVFFATMNVPGLKFILSPNCNFDHSFVFYSRMWCFFFFCFFFYFL